MTTCEVCGQRVRVEGGVTKHYVGVDAEENKELKNILIDLNSRTIFSDQDTAVGALFDRMKEYWELKAKLTIAVEALETIQNAEYLNEYDEKGNFIRMVMPNVMAREALEKIK